MLRMTTIQFTFFFLLATFSLQAQESTYVPNYKFKSGKEVVAVYVGSSHCGPCKAPEFKKNLQKMLVRVSNEIQKSGHNFWVLGISVDNDILAGYEFLKSTGQFDEVSIGRSWNNSAVLRYVLLDKFSMRATPQLILLEREVTKDGAKIKIQNEKILLRLVGNGELKKWLSKNISLAETKTYKGMIFE